MSQKLTLLFCVSMLFSVMTEAKTSKKKPKVEKLAPCEAGMGARGFVKSRVEIQEKVLKAIKANQIKPVLKFVSCDFIIGLPDSDVTVVAAPETVFAQIAGATGKFKWSKDGYDYKSQYNLPSDPLDNVARHELMFRHDEKGWYWAGYATTDHALLKALHKNSYAPEENAQPDGMEPAPASPSVPGH